MKNLQNPLIYNCFDNIELRSEILSICKDPKVKQHIQDLYALIKYQTIVIDDQRREIIAEKHKKAWSHYDQ